MIKPHMVWRWSWMWSVLRPAISTRALATKVVQFWQKPATEIKFWKPPLIAVDIDVNKE
jgi:hypothetical protein